MRKLILMGLAVCLLCGCKSTVGVDTTATETASPDLAKMTCRKIDYYDYSAPVPASEKVDDSYFTDTFFGGDSRMGSIALYSDIPDKGAEVYYAESLRLYMINKAMIESDGGTATMWDLLESTKRNNIYLLLGINEIRGENFDDWASFYEEEVIAPLLQEKPNANIYLMLSYYPQSLADIDEDRLKYNIDTINADMTQIAVKYHLYLLDIDASMKDENGKIRDDLVWDGLHFNQTGAQAYADYIATHVARKDDYVKEVCE